MDITEKDIFYFVFDSNKLKAETKSYIEENIHEFEDEIKLCENLQSTLQEPVSEDIIGKIKDKISRKLETKNIELYKLPVSVITRHEHLTLAADSSEVPQNDVSVDTFVDDESFYMVKVINTKEKKKLLFFEKGHSFMEDFSVRILPSNLTFEHLSNDEPLELEPSEKIEKIILILH